MQKVKMMLLSLALFAVVGGALAFKAKFTNTWCTTDAYQDPVSLTFYCSFNNNGAVTTTTCNGNKIINIKTDDVNPNPVQKVCTTQIDAGTHPCDKLCNQLVSTLADR